MKARTMARLQRTETPHTDWCARDHRCGLDAHRSPEIIADALGGRAVTTRVRAGDRDYAEITIRVRLDHRDPIAARQVGLTLHLINRLIRAVNAVRPEALAGRIRPALDRRSAA
ncbi:hypothetical protein GCM10010112_43780 [Actinoplanes lobatus]|uniref:Uncharacterized protein n=1 Tax=Actinoplanes lobatus TaxID=113568 RepID=A0A7W7HBN8_9ACTN|nr:hypothetical protein [Actinoplanes lobatus]MBB4747583.1 hypothetical protein [Actinoplanes lobatus]GGN74040.1 hypothetical protein GCM10010112_43780 [Actinoplanes lobatus]GIE39856.1 hypothetical protein Alo02nite_27540 [Actinoplanes lobatus]